MLAIKNNMMAANAARYLGKSYDALAQSVERLSSGQRINSAKDDAAGMAVRELMRADIAVVQQGTRNTQDGVSMLQTMEGAMATIDTALVRMKQLAEQASTGSYSSAQRVIMNTEFAEMAAEIERIAKTTTFNGINMLDGVTPWVDIRFGTTADDTIRADGANMTQAGLKIVTGSAGYEVVSATGAATADSDWLTVTLGSRDVTIKFDTGGTFEDSIVVSLSKDHGGDGKYTLNEIAALINAQTENLGAGKNYDMASVVEGADAANGRNPGTYYLKLSSRLSTANSSTITADAVGAGDLAGGWDADPGGAVVLDEAYALHSAGKMGEHAGTGINLLTPTAAYSALSKVADAIGLKDTARAAFGYKINRLQSTGDVLAIQTENLQTAESRISDVDVATEMATLTRNQVLAQAGTAMLAQANSIPQMALTLLR